ncbi:protein of unknown function DUF820 [Gloeothece citriformis PCC 7424]|uniref:Putative restriction endonuclease domain-containing protein n=1 Tax=Gloeothece citriformis (strain PCC 7424) TaxID=65393 RepID=B7K8B6_GLOC7|nr:Uma2 family endonuclease [Gloeothece citriformis]ACK69876.1 protein of unknown function DUF820 [Gloeothece citriformis PCC 7424]
MITLVKWSVEDYHRMIQAGILNKYNCELLAGEIVVMSPEMPIHYNIAKRGTKYLEDLLGHRAEIRFNGAITLPDSEPEPDIAIVKPPHSKYDNHHPYPEDIFWLIEVANTSLKKDLELKSLIYAQAKIPEYWVINLKTKRLIVFRQPQPENYSFQTEWNQETIRPLAFPSLEIKLQNLLN